MSYVDGFVAAVPEANREAYRRHAEQAAALFREHGALEVAELWGDDVPEGEVTSFPLAVRREPGEAVALGWIRWPSKAVRERAWAAMAEDDRMRAEAMPFDGRRIIHGGFEPLLEG
jgi:uncharacterized protein YbaA (DUF1428 family)